MVELAIDIVAFCIVVAAGIAALAILDAICSAFSGWLDAAPGRRKRFWWTVGAVIAVPALLIWHAASPAGLEAVAAGAAGIGAMVALAVGILRIKDRWPAVGVALVWLTWWGLVLGLIAVVLHEQGRLP